MPQQNYLDELTPAFRLYWRLKKPLAVYYVMTLPVSGLPGTDRSGEIYSLNLLSYFKGAAETIRENNALGAVCAECARRRNYAKAVVHVPVLMLH